MRGTGIQGKAWMAVLLVSGVACSRPDAAEPEQGQTAEQEETAERAADHPETNWLTGDTETRFAQVEQHLRGFDVAMVEAGYRYIELYWAGEGKNWDYAAYQLAKIETAVANGVERRPKRAASAAMLDGAVEGVRAAIAAHDAQAFDSAFTTLTQTCNSCHLAERVPFVHIEPPEQRISPVRADHCHRCSKGAEDL